MDDKLFEQVLCLAVVVGVTVGCWIKLWRDRNIF
jgi:hypothetical protein